MKWGREGREVERGGRKDGWEMRRGKGSEGKGMGREEKNVGGETNVAKEGKRWRTEKTTRIEKKVN